MVHKNEQEQYEVSFDFTELFFSRTDTRGILEAGNGVFGRISLYSWDELIKKPHNVIRHSDMPKGVFYLFWQFLKQKKPIGAYVKNRAKDGRHYWVFAIATPVENGYLSVRLKPSSNFFQVAQKEYEALLKYEHDNNVTPQQSSEKLLQDLKGLGFGSYDEFMSSALGEEILSRDRNLGRVENKVISSLNQLMKEAKSLDAESEKITSSYEENRYVPMNLRIQSFKLEEQGRAISVISGNYDIVSNEIKEELGKFSNSASDVFRLLFEGQFLLCTASIQKEVVKFFEGEHISEDNPTNKLLEMKSLEGQQVEYQKRAKLAIAKILSQIDSFEDDCSRMRRCAASLEVIRVMAKIDTARLTDYKGALNELLNNLQTFQDSINDSLSKIDDVNSQMKYHLLRASA
ncbi:MAG: PAS domain-containing protein [Rickettsiales bacterium]